MTLKSLAAWLFLVSRRHWLWLAAGGLALALPWALETQYLRSQENQVRSQSAAVERNIRDFGQRLDNLTAEIRGIEANRDAFETLVATGFVGGVDRLAARRVLEAATDANRLLGITYQIGAELRREERILEREGMRYISAEISVEAQAFLDADIFRFERTLARDLPGILVPLRLELRLARNFDRDAVEDISRGRTTPMVTGAYLGRWEAIRPDATGQGRIP